MAENEQRQVSGWSAKLGLFGLVPSHAAGVLLLSAAVLGAMWLCAHSYEKNPWLFGIVFLLLAVVIAGVLVAYLRKRRTLPQERPTIDATASVGDRSMSLSRIPAGQLSGQRLPELFRLVFAGAEPLPKPDGILEAGTYRKLDDKEAETVRDRIEAEGWAQVSKQLAGLAAEESAPQRSEVPEGTRQDEQVESDEGGDRESGRT